MKRTHKLTAFLLSLVLLLGVFAPAAAAAAEPSIRCVNDGLTIVTGGSDDLIFSITRAYPQERYYLYVYDSEGVEIAYTDDDIISDTSNVELTIPVDTDAMDMTVGTYTVEFYLSYVSGSKQTNTPKQTASFSVVANTCSGRHSYGSVQTLVEPTCNRAGQGKKVCNACGYAVFTQLSPKHTYTDSADQKCDACGHARQMPTLKKENGIWRYYDDGVFTEATTLVKYQYSWYYVVNGILADTYTGLVKYNGSWYYVRNGKLDSSATTLVKYNGEWWYVINGKLSSGTTGLVKYNGEWWYVVNGKVASNTTTLVKYNGEWWYVLKGKIASNTTTLVNFWGGWYYIYKGKVAGKTTTLFKYNGIWYYVENGQVNFNYNGTFYYCYKNYTIQNGRVV